MSLIFRKAFLEPKSPFIQCKRFRGKINVQRPKPPHFEKATYLALSKPWFISPYKDKTSVDLCKFNKLNKEEEFNPYNNIIAKELYSELKTSKLVVFYHHNTIKADERFKYYAMFKKQGMDLKQYGRKILQLAVNGTPYETLLEFYKTINNMILFCPEVEIAKVLKMTKKCPQLVVLAGIFENKLISKDDLEKFSKIPNIQAAQSELVQRINGVGSKLVNDLNFHQNHLALQLDSRIKQLEEDKVKSLNEK